MCVPVSGCPSTIKMPDNARLRSKSSCSIESVSSVICVSSSSAGNPRTRKAVTNPEWLYSGITFIGAGSPRPGRKCGSSEEIVFGLITTDGPILLRAEDALRRRSVLRLLTAQRYSWISRTRQTTEVPGSIQRRGSMISLDRVGATLFSGRPRLVRR